MSAIATGIYYIGLISVQGALLATTFNEPGVSLIVNDIVIGQSSQAWNISSYDNTDMRVISPVDDNGVQAVPWGDSIITLSVTEDYPWVIQGADNRFTIQDQELTLYWDVEEPSEGQSVIAKQGGSQVAQEWLFLPFKA